MACGGYKNYKLKVCLGGDLSPNYEKQN